MTTNSEAAIEVGDHIYAYQKWFRVAVETDVTVQAVRLNEVIPPRQLISKTCIADHYVPVAKVVALESENAELRATLVVASETIAERSKQHDELRVVVARVAKIKPQTGLEEIGYCALAAIRVLKPEPEATK